MAETEIPTVHWADHAADRLIERSPNQPVYVCASGISPSGVVHIGNFREVITVDFVVRALRKKGKAVRFIYSWDDYDALRKVPKNLPNEKLIAENLRRPIAKIPDPFGTHTSYASHFEDLFEKEIAQLGVRPEFIYQCEAYESGRYVKWIETALKQEEMIRKILNAARTENLEADWTCVTIYCSDCGRDTTAVKAYRAPQTFDYHCTACKQDRTIDMSKTPGVKLLWRVDWPMRWDFERVDFEPGGKDHSSTGGSYETGCHIVREIYRREPPVYVQYDFVLAKGMGNKLSSSTGNLITLSQALQVYEPNVLRWIFASRKPNLDFSIAFDLDVIKTYDDFDRCERVALKAEEAIDKKHNYENRIYELSLIDSEAKPARCPPQFAFRHLCNILQIHQGSIEKALNHYQVTDASDRVRFVSRSERAWKWICDYAPQEFRFCLRGDNAPMTKTPQPAALADLASLIEGADFGVGEDVLTTQIFDITKKHSLPPKVFFEAVYDALISKKAGPKLASFLIAIGKEKAASLLKRAL
ncbi:MAG: lysine--tRNA ligase [Deltaproteobacteria bacterium]|nr:lysine--tRNA ligase [Deltaproteobacteria bacterium]MBI3295092.1 lysine--tRNA ligase [Deltaproteobacteria bacterium]